MRAAVALLSVCTILVASACSHEGGRRVHSVTVPGGSTVKVVATEYRFDPGRVIVKSSGRTARLRIAMMNSGTLAHNLYLRDGDRDLGATPTLRPGEKRSLSARLPPGSYSLICTVGDHAELGMTGKLEVR